MKMVFTLLFVAVFALSVFSQGTTSATPDKDVLSKGDTAPDFTLKDQKGKDVTLSKLVKKTPVVLLFYRGFW